MFNRLRSGRFIFCRSYESPDRHLAERCRLAGQFINFITHLPKFSVPIVSPIDEHSFLRLPGMLYFWHRIGNGFLTLLSNIFTDLNLSDMETCYKAFRREIIQSIKIEENRFGFEPEITAKISKLNLRIYEVGIAYYGRTYTEGKKITWKDGIRAIYCILKYNLFN